MLDSMYGDHIRDKRQEFSGNIKQFLKNFQLENRIRTLYKFRILKLFGRTQAKLMSFSFIHISPTHPTRTDDFLRSDQGIKCNAASLYVCNKPIL